MNYLVFNGESSADFGIYVGGQGTFGSAHRDYEKVSIPGRNGDLIRDNGRYLNCEITYPIVIMDNFATKTDAVNAWIGSTTGYCRLEDSYHPDYYRMAAVAASITYTTGFLNRAGRGDLTFDCKPQKWLKSGEEAVTFTASGTVTNPTRFTSKPLIRVYGTGAGTVTIGNQVITISAIDTYVDVDSEVQDCYKGVENCNANVSLGSSGFPVFESGSTGISFSGLITKLEVYPRWWTL